MHGPSRRLRAQAAFATPPEEAIENICNVVYFLDIVLRFRTVLTPSARCAAITVGVVDIRRAQHRRHVPELSDTATARNTVEYCAATL
jgi:hypothetical protein